MSAARRHRWLRLAWPALLLVAGGTGGCGGQKLAWRRIETGEVLTQGVTLRATDGSFQYSAGAPFATPWTAEDCPLEPTTSNWALAPGARPVIVETPYGKTLYGLLAFCPAPAHESPSGRSHGLQVPREYVEETSGGRVTFVVDDVPHAWRYPTNARQMRTVERWPTWVLWLSERPLR